ncbi:MAG TPA: methyltransferase domain-containing protein [Polyangiaceae bacterium]|nr:methyltransferase domain-containing protein [Polyangiaceae bacterium]
MLELTLSMLQGIPKNGFTDPIEFYRRPLLGRIFRERINRGLRLLPERRFSRALEVGYGSGAVLLSLAPGVDDLHGLDLEADPAVVLGIMKSRGVSATLRQGNVYELPYDTDSFDLVVSFSMFEHLHEYRKALAEVVRVMRPGGLFLLGMPAVNKLMSTAFIAMGVTVIDDHHVTTPAEVARAFGDAGLALVAKTGLDLPLPVLGARVYYDWLLEKPGGREAPRP